MLTLKQIRIGMNKTQEEMASILDISAPTYRNCEENPGQLRVHQLDKMINLYNELAPTKIRMDDVIIK